MSSKKMPCSVGLTSWPGEVASMVNLTAGSAAKAVVITNIASSPARPANMVGFMERIAERD
jgi:hypothetical protein